MSPERPHETERECAELWRWVHQLERLAELGIHARGLAHDLGNTLTSLLAGLELALLKRDEAGLRASVGKSLDLAREAAARLHAHVDFTRRARKQEPPLALGEALEDALRLIAHPLRKMGVHVERDVEHAVCATASRPQIVQVIVNALLAVLAARPATGAELDLRVAVVGGEAVLDVEARNGKVRYDTGNGRDALDHTDLELEIARRVVAACGGRLDLVPEARRARLSLPAANGAYRRAPAASEATATWRPAAVHRLHRAASQPRP